MEKFIIPLHMHTFSCLSGTARNCGKPHSNSMVTSKISQRDIHPLIETFASGKVWLPESTLCLTPLLQDMWAWLMHRIWYYWNIKLAVLTFEIVMQTDTATPQASGFTIR
jgi:hypothetical protein